MIETKNQRISMISEDENLSELVDKAKMKVMQREVKDLERRKVKMEKLYEKMCGKSYTKEEIVDEEMSTELNENRKTMKKSELKEMIKAAMMSEINIDIQDTNADYDPLYEENEAMRPFDTNKPARIAAFILALDNLLDEYHAELYLSDDIFAAIEAAKSAAKLEMGREDEMDDMPGFEGTKDSLRSLGLEEAEEEVDAEEVDVEVGDEEVETTDVETTAEVDPNIKAVQDSLTAAQAAAAALGDEKLTDQIGNTITFFTRQHVANIDSMNESINESTVHRGTDGQINRLL